MDPLVIAAVMSAWVLVALLLALLFVAARQHGRALVQLEEVRNNQARIEEQLVDVAAGVAALGQSTLNAQLGHNHVTPPLPAGLPRNSRAPDFSLPDLQGRVYALRDFAGTESLVVFFSLHCGYCQQMAPRLGQLRPGGPRVLVVGEGPADDYRALAEEHHWQCEVLLDKGGAVAQAYLASGTPTGYLLDAEGRIASSLAIGADALLRLLPAAPSAPGATVVADGLPAGVSAPAFVLPDSQGTRRTLEDFHGMKVLLVFVDPACEGSRTLAARLGGARSSVSRADRQLVFVSRGRTPENRLWEDQYGLAGPVLLQQGWEVAAAYGAFATPAAYLLDERGQTRSGLYVGPDGVLELAHEGHVP